MSGVIIFCPQKYSVFGLLDTENKPVVVRGETGGDLGEKYEKN